MSQRITIELPGETRKALLNAAVEEGMSEQAFVEKAVADFLFIRRFRGLRERMASEVKQRTDEDVFDLVS